MDEMGIADIIATFGFLGDIIEQMKENETDETQILVNVDEIVLGIDCKTNLFQLIEDLELF